MQKPTVQGQIEIFTGLIAETNDLVAKNVLRGFVAGLKGRSSLTSAFWQHRASALIQSAHFNRGHEIGLKTRQELSA